MSQIEQNFRHFLAKKPEIEKCYKHGLINRRSLARFLIQNRIAKGSQMEAVIAMLRRFYFGKKAEEKEEKISLLKTNIKDNIIILDFEKEKSLFGDLEKVISHINYDKGDTLKIVIGVQSIKLFIDKERESEIRKTLSKYKVKHNKEKISEISTTFEDNANKTKGILSLITKEFLLNEINIIEMLTTTPELILYVKEEDALKAYTILKSLQ